MHQELEEAYNELLMVSQEFKVIQRNQVDLDDSNEKPRGPLDEGQRKNSDVSLFSQDLVMMMDVPVDFLDDGGEIDS